MSVHFNGNFKEQKISEECARLGLQPVNALQWVFLFIWSRSLLTRSVQTHWSYQGLLDCRGPCSSSLDASVCYPFCTTWTKDVLSLQFGWQGQYQHPHTQVSLVSRTNRNASNWDDTPYGIGNILRCCMLSKNVRDKTLSKQRPQVLSWVNCFQNTNQLGVMLFGYRVRTGHGKPGKSWNLIISFSRPAKSWNLIVGPGKSWKIKDLYNR